MFKLLNKKKNNKGFTLVELVIVIAILALLVGLLAPQYTKYVEKSRKAADASNMDELVKVVKVYAGDTDSELPKGAYKITIGAEDATNTGISDAPGGLTDELNKAVPDWSTKLTTKSKKWNAGESGDISATVTVAEDGGVSVTYEPQTFADYMATR